MCSSITVLLLVLPILSTSQAFVAEFAKTYIPGCNINITHIKNVRPRDFEGAWYFTHSFANGDVQGCNGCWTAKFYTKDNDTSYIMSCCQSLYNTEVVCGDEYGSGLLIDVFRNGTYIFRNGNEDNWGYPIVFMPKQLLVGYVCTEVTPGKFENFPFVYTRLSARDEAYDQVVKDMIVQRGVPASAAVRVIRNPNCIKDIHDQC